VRQSRHGRHAFHVGGEARGVQGADVLGDRHQHLAAQVAALLLGGELVLEVDAGGARLDHRPHQLVGVERAAEAGLGVGDDRRHVVGLVVGLAVRALEGRDLVGAAQRVVDALDDGRDAVHRVERLVGVHGGGRVGVRRHLPAGQVDGLQPRLHLLERLHARERAERVHVGLALQELPQAPGAAVGQGVLHPEGTGQALHVRGGVVAADALEAAGLVPVAAEGAVGREGRGRGRAHEVSCCGASGE
jgi:hypothetical protein